MLDIVDEYDVDASEKGLVQRTNTTTKRAAGKTKRPKQKTLSKPKQRTHTINAVRTHNDTIRKMFQPSV